MKTNPQFHPDTFKFLKTLKSNNNKEWFDKNRPTYEKIKKDFYGFVDELIIELRKFNPDIEPLEAKNCVFRINRDIRFSKDKSPYKHHLAAVISRGGKKSHFAGYYFHIEPNGNTYIGGGVWRPEKDVLDKVRQEIDYNQKSFEKIILNKSFKSVFGTMNEDKMSTAPKNYAKDDPAIEWLKYKSYVFGVDMKDADAMSKTALVQVVKTFKTLSPFIQFLNTAIGD